MVCATLGHQSLTPYAKGFSAFHAFLAMIVVAFTIIGTASYSNKTAADYRVPWATAKYTVTDNSGATPVEHKVTVDFGLRSYTTYMKHDGEMVFIPQNPDPNDPTEPAPAACPVVGNKDIVLFKDCANAACWNLDGNPVSALIVEQCSVCKKAGTNAVSALIVSIVFSAIAVIAFFMRTCNDGTLGKDLSIIAVLVSFAFLIAGYASAKPCKDAIEVTAALMTLGGLETEVTFGVGIKFVTAAWALLLWLIPFALLVPVPQVHEHAPVGKV